MEIALLIVKACELGVAGSEYLQSDKMEKERK
jgi:hypothetical protein